MKPYIIALFGHRDLCAHRKVEKNLTEILTRIARTGEYIEVYIGRNGEFDVFAASVVKRMMEKYGYCNLNMTLVLPYTNKDIHHYEKYYSSITIPERAERMHPKGAITERNRWMVEKCDLFIGYIEHEGGSMTAMNYAKRLGKRIINIAEATED